MNKQRFITGTVLGIAVSLVVLGIGLTIVNHPTTKESQKSPAQQSDAAQGLQGSTLTQNPQDATIMDAAGRVHKVMPMRQMTHEQRKAAAERAKESRAARHGRGKLVAPASQGGGTQ